MVVGVNACRCSFRAGSGGGGCERPSSLVSSRGAVVVGVIIVIMCRLGLEATGRAWLGLAQARPALGFGWPLALA